MAKSSFENKTGRLFFSGVLHFQRPMLRYSAFRSLVAAANISGSPVIELTLSNVITSAHGLLL
jgi:hypothetical protein